MKKTTDKEKGLDPVAYIALLEKQLQEQQALVNRLKEKLQSKEEYIANLMEMLVKSQKTIYGQSSEKERYQKQEDALQLAMFNEAEAEALASLAPAEEPMRVSSYQRKPKRSNEELMKGLPVKQGLTIKALSFYDGTNIVLPYICHYYYLS